MVTLKVVAEGFALLLETVILVDVKELILILDWIPHVQWSGLRLQLLLSAVDHAHSNDVSVGVPGFKIRLIQIHFISSLQFELRLLNFILICKNIRLT